MARVLYGKQNKGSKQSPFFFASKNWSPKLTKRGIKHFPISNIDKFEKKIWSLPFQPLLDFPDISNNCISFGIRKHMVDDTNIGILLPKLFWLTVGNNCSSDREKLLKYEAEGLEFATFLRSLEQFIQTVKCQNNFWQQNAFLTCSWRFFYI